MPKRILIVEDEIVVRRAIRAFLELHHFEICGEAVNGAEALEKAAALRPDLITLDLSMPLMRLQINKKVPGHMSGNPTYRDSSLRNSPMM